jgi:hypothetical protein
MPPLDAFLPSIAIGLILFVMLWFALGTQRNIRKGNEVLRWLQGGLPILGRRTTMRWLGSSAVELGIVEPAAPFREAQVVVVLEPRDVSLLWAFARWRGRRDFVIVRVSLVRPPRFGLDVRDPGGWTSRSDAPDNGHEVPTGERPTDDWPAQVAVTVGPGTADPAVRATWEQLTEVSGGIWRLTVQPVVPHLEVHVRPPALEGVSADRLLGPIRDLAETLSRR